MGNEVNAIDAGHLPLEATEKAVRCVRPQPESEYPIEGGRRPSTLHMSEHHGPCIEAGVTLNEFLDVFSSCRAFGDNNDRAELAFLSRLLKLGADLSKRVGNFGYEDCLGTAGQRGLDCDKAVPASHDFDDEHAIMRICSVPHLVNCLNSRVDRRIESNRKVRSADLVVDRARNSHHGKTELLMEFESAGERSIPADHDKSFDCVASESFDR